MHNKRWYYMTCLNYSCPKLLTYFQLSMVFEDYVSWDSLAGIVTGCGLDSWGLIPSRRKIFLFSIPFRPAVGLTQPIGSYHVDKAAGA
jgi:hypothetical protein